MRVLCACLCVQSTCVLTCIRVHLHVHCVHVCGCTHLYTTVFAWRSVCVPVCLPAHVCLCSHVRVHVCVHTCVSVCVCACRCACCVRLCAWLCVRVHACMAVCMSVCVYVCTSVCACLCVHTRMCMHLHVLPLCSSTCARRCGPQGAQGQGPDPSAPGRVFPARTTASRGTALFLAPPGAACSAPGVSQETEDAHRRVCSWLTGQTNSS